MRLHHYCNNSGKDLIMEYIHSLSATEQTDGLTVLEHLENNEMEKVTFKRWQKKVYEVYFYKHNRLFYVVLDKDNMYILHACKKQKNKTEKGDQQIVIKRAKELGKLVHKSFV